MPKELKTQYNTLLTDLISKEDKEALDNILRETIVSYMELHPQGCEPTIKA
jgi:hypothetical protein